MGFNPRVDASVQSQAFELQHKYLPDNLVFYCAAFGSYNYGLEVPGSDVDTKAMVLPTSRQVVMHEKQLSFELEMKSGDHCDVKDVRLMTHLMLKSDVTYLELLYSPYWCADNAYMEFVQKLRSYRDFLANHDPLRLMKVVHGRAMQRYKDFDKGFEGKKELLKRVGYDPKQLHHLARYVFFMADYLKLKDFKLCLRPEGAEKEFLVALKGGTPLSLESAQELREFYKKRAEELYAEAKAQFGTKDQLQRAEELHVQAVNLMDDLVYQVVWQHLKEEMFRK